MPADHLATTRTIEPAIVAVLAGTPLAEAASSAGMETTALAEAIEVYRQAGRRALDQHTYPGWWQVYLRFTDWDRAEHTAAEHLAPLLHRADTDGVTSAWWFIRKHPCWRLRLHRGPAGHTMTAGLSAALDGLTACGDLDSWWPGIYEPETAAFGDQPGIDIAHDLFCADSRAIFTLLGQNETGLGRRELSLLLGGTLMRAAHAEWYEQGDIWHRLTQQRPLPTDIPTEKITGMAATVRQTLLADTAPDGPLLSAGGRLAPIAVWAEAFRTAGRALGAAASQGALRRGLREVISYAIIFHWNRLGLAARTQAILAHAARTAILDMSAVSANAAAATP